jgi:hypothetical protein
MVMRYPSELDDAPIEIATVIGDLCGLHSRTADLRRDAPLKNGLFIGVCAAARAHWVKVKNPKAPAVRPRPKRIGGGSSHRNQ